MSLILTEKTESERTNRQTLSRWGIYTVGMLVLAMGLTLNTKTGLGVSPILSLAYCSTRIWGVNLGDATFVLYALFVIAQLILRGKRRQWYDLLQLPLSLVFSRVLNVYDRWVTYDPARHGLAANLVCLALAILVPLARTLLLGLPTGWSVWVYRALTFLVISCPCALVISIPLSFFAGIGGASKAGVLVKGSNYLEILSQTDYVVFDKTGTLTQGVFEVAGIHHAAMDQDRLLEYAALAESASSHPISKSLQKAYGKPLDRSRVGEIQEIAGHGVLAQVDGHTVAAGNDKLMDRIGVPAEPCRQVGTVIHVAVDGQYAGHILIADVVKPTAKAAIQALKAAGVEKTVMLTGDRDQVAQQVAGALGVDQVYSQLLPADKVEKVEQLLEEKPPKKKLAFVGDGINDAPVLSRADIGIAMGAMGSDAAIEAADVVLMDDDPMQIPKAIKISRKCLGIVYQNIVFAIGVKGVCLVLGALGIANMWLAIFADVGVMILAVLNAIRALFVKNL